MRSPPTVATRAHPSPPSRAVEELDALSPFVLCVDEELIVRSAGRSILRRRPDAVGTPLASLIAREPAGSAPRSLDRRVIAPSVGSIFPFRLHCDGDSIPLAGMWLSAQGGFTLLAFPRPAGDTGLGGLTLDDFAEGSLQLALLVLRDELACSTRDAREVIASLRERVSVLEEKEHELRALAERQELLLDVTATAVFTVDADKRITSVNRSFLELTGYREAEVIGQPCRFLKAPECERSCDLFDPGQSGRQCKVARTFRTEEGRPLHVIKNAERLLDESGAVAGGIESFVEVTEIVETHRQAREASEAKSRFLMNLSHEVRTPLNGILGMADLLLDDEPRANQRDRLEELKASGVSLQGLLDDLLDLQQLERGSFAMRKTSFDLLECVEGARATLAFAAREKGLRLESEIAPDVPARVAGDGRRLRQVLVILLSNAVRFTERGGVTLGVSRANGPEEVGARIELRVSDTGRGFPRSAPADPFQPFWQGDDGLTRKHGGLGIGLAIAHRIVAKLGGELALDCEDGKGSTLRFTIPLPAVDPEISGGRASAREASREATPSPLGDRAERQRAGGLNVLVAEDNPVNRKVIGKLLEKEGHSVELTVNGLDALEAWKRGGHDLILMDVQMPELDGLEATVRIREAERESGTHTPIVAVTAHALGGDRERCIEAGMDDYITKPLTKGDLQEAIERAVAGNREARRDEERETALP